LRDIADHLRAGDGVSELADFSCNLRAPIVVWNGRGHQVINEAQDAPARAELFGEAAVAVHAA
jgi:flagellar assembly factor FliW